SISLLAPRTVSGSVELITTLSGHTKSILKIQFSHDGQFLASSSKDGTVRLWSVVAGKPFATIVGAHDSEPWEMSWSPDDRKFAITSRHKRSWEVVVWEISSTKTPIISRQFHATYFLQWSPDNRTFLAFDRHTNLNVLDSVSGQLVNTLTPQLSK